MNKSQRQVGIQIENNIRITSEVSIKYRGLTVLTHVLFVLLGAIGIIYSWVEGFSLYVDHKLLLTGIVITVLIQVGLNEIKRNQWVFFLIYFAIVGGFTYHYWAYIQNGFYCLENAIIKKAAVYYGLNPVRFLVKLEYDKATTAILLLVVQAVAVVTALEVYKHYMRSVYLFCILIFYGGLLAVGVTPPGEFMLLVLLCYLSFRTMDHIPGAYHKLGLFWQFNHHEVPGNGKQKLRIKSALVMVSCILVALVLVRTIVTKDFYNQHFDLEDRKKVLQQSIREFSVASMVDQIKEDWNEINPFAGDKSLASGGLDSGKLGDVGEVKFTGETALNVTVDEAVTYLYLKGFAGGEYRSDEWADLSDAEMEAYQEIVDQYGDGKHNAETLLWEWFTFHRSDAIPVTNSHPITVFPQINISLGDVQVSYENANKEFLYAPYTSNYQEIGELSAIGDQYIVSKEEKDNYRFIGSYLPYHQFTDLNQLTDVAVFNEQIWEIEYSEEYESFLAFEKEYQDFVHESYTKLPEEGLERLRGIPLEMNGSGLERTRQAVQSVIRYLHDNTNYSLSPGVPEEGEDYAEDFLFNKKEGFCSHYATTAVLLLRNYGIPARYVEGYVVTNQDIRETVAGFNGRKTVDVQDYNAHAWVEVYFDGVGWIPVEVTKGYSENGVSELLPEIQGENGDENATATPTATATPIPPSPTAKPQATKVPTTSPTKAPSSQASADDIKPASTLEMWQSLGLLCIAGIFAFLAFFIVHYFVKKHRKWRNLTKGLPKEQGIYSYQMIENLLAELKVIKSESMSYIEFATFAMQACPFLPLEFEEIVTIALKAKFAKEGITQKEADRLRNYYIMFYTKVFQSQSKRKRFALKYWKGY